jgi:hypothetical protein
MGSLGTFGTPREINDETFTYFGIDVRCHPTMSDLSLHDFMERAAVIDETDPAAWTLVKDFIREQIHPEDFDKFWFLARQNRQNTADLMEVAKGLYAAVAGRPTTRPSGSARGRPRTRRKSAAGSSSPVIGRLKGRPDLQLAVVMAQEAQAASG